MHIVAFIQARMGSTRLPDKVMLDLAGQPMLARVVHRSQQAEILNDVVVVTSTNLKDQAIVDLCAERGWPCFRGSEADVLDRYYRAALAHRADIVVRITADCPLIAPDVVACLVKAMVEGDGLDYVNNRLPPITYPRGMEMDVMTFQTLEVAWREDDRPKWREHVTPYIYNHPDRFEIHTVRNDVDHSQMVWTVDSPEDLTFVRRIYDYFGQDSFSYQDVVDVLNAHQEWLEINRSIKTRSLPYMFS